MMKYFSWRVGQPDNGGGPYSSTLYEDRGMMYGASVTYSKLFNDLPEGNGLYYVCELNMCDSTQYYDTSVMPPICSKLYK